LKSSVSLHHNVFFYRGLKKEKIATKNSHRVSLQVFYKLKQPRESTTLNISSVSRKIMVVFALPRRRFVCVYMLTKILCDCCYYEKMTSKIFIFDWFISVMCPFTREPVFRAWQKIYIANTIGAHYILL